MRICFVLPFSNVTGGIRVALEYATRLRTRGHVTSVVFPLVPYRFRTGGGSVADLLSWTRNFYGRLGQALSPPWQGDYVQPTMVPLIADPFVPEGDVVIATAWPTAYSVAHLSPAKGAQCYLVQHREIDSGPPAVVDSSYRLPLFRIAGSRFTAGQLREQLGVVVDAVVSNGVDVGFWAGGPQADGARSGVLMPHVPVPHKGMGDGFSALSRVHQARPEIPLRLFGRRRSADVPAFVEYVERPTDRTLRSLYRGALMMLYPSRFEGFGLPPLEAMAAGCPIVATRVGAIPDFCLAGETGLLVEPGDVEGMTRGLLELLADPGRRLRMGEAATERARAFDLERATDAFEAALGRAVSAARSH